MGDGCVPPQRKNVGEGPISNFNQGKLCLRPLGRTAEQPNELCWYKAHTEFSSHELNSPKFFCCVESSLFWWVLPPVSFSPPLSPERRRGRGKKRDLKKVCPPTFLLPLPLPLTASSSPKNLLRKQSPLPSFLFARDS